MDIELLFSLTLRIAYVLLRVFLWRGTTESKSAFWTRDLIENGCKEDKIVKSAYWTRDLIQTNQKSK
jgi:hypothetical protein